MPTHRKNFPFRCKRFFCVRQFYIFTFHTEAHKSQIIVSHNALFWKSQTHSVNDSIYNFEIVFLEFPEKNCIVGMLLTCPIVPTHLTTWFELRVSSKSLSVEHG